MKCLPREKKIKKIGLMHANERRVREIVNCVEVNFVLLSYFIRREHIWDLRSSMRNWQLQRHFV